jgi:hypothetical protein
MNFARAGASLLFLESWVTLTNNNFAVCDVFAVGGRHDLARRFGRVISVMDGGSRRQAVVGDRARGRLSWADSRRSTFALGTAGWRHKAVSG